jgi:hypothetical protein
MPIEEVNRGLIGNDPNADTIREAFRKVNGNFVLVNDNIDIKLELTISTGATVAQIKNQVNALPQFTVTEKQSLWLVCTAYEDDEVTLFRRDLYKIFNKGAGTYGVGSLTPFEVEDFEKVDQYINTPPPTINQDNIMIVKRLRVIGTGNTAILLSINSLRSYVVTETQSVLFVVMLRADVFASYSTYKYQMVNKGKGTYGAGATQLELDDLELIYQNVPVVTDVEDDPRTDSIDYGTLTGQNISSWLNVHSLITIQPQDEGYTLFTGTIDGVAQSYLWIGEPGSYGTGALQSTAADFQLLSETTPVVPAIPLAGTDSPITGKLEFESNNDDIFGLITTNTITGYTGFIGFDEFGVPMLFLRYGDNFQSSFGLDENGFILNSNDPNCFGFGSQTDFTERALQNPLAYLQVKGIIQLINDAIAGGGGSGTLQDLASVIIHGATSATGFTIGADGVLTVINPNEIITQVPDGRKSRLTHNGLELQASTSGFKVRISGGTQSADHVVLLQDKSYTVAGLDDISTAIDTALASIYRPAGNYDASGGTFPTSGTGPSGGIRRGDVFNVSVAGSIAGEMYDVGDTFYANTANPGQVAANWKRFEVNTSQATSSYRGTILLFNSTGTSTSGTIDQNALTLLLASKANDNAVVHAAGDETVTGQKIFTSSADSFVAEVRSTGANNNAPALIITVPSTGTKKGFQIRSATNSEGTTFGLGWASFEYSIGGGNKPGLALGDGTSSNRDTNIYRDAANVLKTDDKFVAALGLDSGSSKITNVATGTASTDAVNKNQLDALNTLSAAINVSSNLTLSLAMFGKNGELDLFVNAAAGAITVTLPTSATMEGYKVNVIKTDASANAVIVKGAGTTNINQANTYSLTTQNQTATIKSNTTQYWIF